MLRTIVGSGSTTYSRGSPYSLPQHPDGDVALVESGGDSLTLTFSSVLADYFVIDVTQGDKIPPQARARRHHLRPAGDQ